MVFFPTEEYYQKQKLIQHFPLSPSATLYFILSSNFRRPTQHHQESEKQVQRRAGAQTFPESPGGAVLQLSLASQVCDSGQGIQPLPSLSFLLRKMRAMLFLSTLQKCSLRITNEITYVKHPLQCMVRSRSSKNDKIQLLFLILYYPRELRLSVIKGPSYITDQVRNTQTNSSHTLLLLCLCLLGH